MLTYYFSLAGWDDWKNFHFHNMCLVLTTASSYMIDEKNLGYRIPSLYTKAMRQGKIL